MVRAYVMVITATGKSPELLPQIRDIEAVEEAHIVAGEFDIIVEVEAEESRELLDVVASEIQSLDGIGATRSFVVLE